MIGSTTRNERRCALTLAALALVLVPAARAEGPAPKPSRIRIGMMDVLLKDVPDNMLTAMQTPFNALMAQQTGLTADLVKAGDYNQLARQLAEDRIQLGIFPGLDFAWARQKYPELKPLMICVNKYPYLRASLVVRTDAKIAGWDDLRGRTLVLPAGSPDHCRLFLERRSSNLGPLSGSSPIKLARGDDFEDALDRVVDGTAAATVIDQVSLECFRRRKPGRFARLKTVQQSEMFPCSCIAYHGGKLDAATLAKFQKGMTNANRTYLGQRMFQLFKMTAFAPVPDGHAQTLADIAKAYPPSVELVSGNPPAGAERSAEKGR